MLINHLDIKSYRVDIHDAKTDLLYQLIMENGITPSEQTKINIAPRVRMTTLYAISQSVNGRVANTSNLSESWVGYDTKFGDSVGDFSPLFNLTKTEIRLIGNELRLPEELVNKTPIDGLCGQTDEDKFGFTYEVLDKYIRTGICENEVIKNKIDTMHEKNLFKLQPMPSFQL
jgi:NAD+ synthase